MQDLVLVGTALVITLLMLRALQASVRNAAAMQLLQHTSSGVP